MRKLIFNFSMFLVLFGLLFLVSCNDDDDPIINSDGPSISVQVNGEDTGPFEASVGQSFIMNLNVTDDDGVDSVVVRKFVGNVEDTDAAHVVYPATPGGSVNQDVEIPLTGVTANDEVRFEITAYDTEGNSNTETVFVNISSIGSFTTVLLYAPLADETSESFFSTSTGQTYSLNDLDMNGGSAPMIDFGYYYGATNNATLASPQHINDIGIFDLSGWGTVNTTQFRSTTITGAEFLENEGNAEFISGGFANGEVGEEAQYVANLQVGDVIAFKLSEGQENRSGLIRVSNIVPGDGVNNYIEIDVLISYEPGE